MTAAGLASMFVAQDYLHSNDGIRCTGNTTNPSIEAGLKWMSENFASGGSDGYFLYGVERTGVASGYKYFGKHDWYQEGANALMKNQKADGSWGSKWGPIPGTSFGIFFLTHGRAPIVMNKLQYEFETPENKKKSKDKQFIANWNQRPRDAANVVRWIGEHMERDLNWQIVNLKFANDLHDAPILYIAGDQQLRLSGEDKARLKNYVEQGGLILGQADCGKTEFAQSFRQLGSELFPSYEFRSLPSAHLIFNEQFLASKWKTKIEVEGLSNGARELMLLIPVNDVAKSWQMQSSATKESHFALASNIFLYTVDRSNLSFKGETYILTANPKAAANKTIKLARIHYNGNWDPEPGGWRRLAIYLLNERKLKLQVEPVRLEGSAAVTSAPEPQVKADRPPREVPPPSGKAEKSPQPANEAIGLKGFNVAHMTGTTAFTLNDAARKEIRDFIESGGTLIIDATGGATAFADAAEKELKQIFQAQFRQLEAPLKRSHEVYHLPNAPITEVAYRNFAKEKLGKNLKLPRIRGLNIKGRTAVFYSREDLSSGLVGQQVDGIYGYDPKSATSLVANIIAYASGERPPPTAQPATAPAK